MNKNVRPPPQRTKHVFFSFRVYLSTRRSRDFDKEDERGVIFSRDSRLYIYIYIYTYTNGIKVELKSSHVKSRVYLEGYLSFWKAYCTEKMRRTVEKNGRSIASYDLAERTASALSMLLLRSLVIYTGGKNLFCRREKRC